MSVAKNNNSSIFYSKGWKVGMKYLYGIGASVVIIGALFKILHLPGANEMLIVGLGTEAVIFFFSAFEPLPGEEKYWDWNKVFPQLDQEIEEDADELSLEEGQKTASIFPGLSNTNQLLQDNRLTPELFESLNESIKGLKTNVKNLSDISDVTTAANEFGDKLKVAAGKMDQWNSGYGQAVEAMKQFSGSAEDFRAYQMQLKGITQNLESLNSIYEAELQDSQKSISSLKNFYAGMGGMVETISQTSKDAETLRQEVASLSKNMQSLNNIYGGMLNAMTSAVHQR